MACWSFVADVECGERTDESSSLIVPASSAHHDSLQPHAVQPEPAAEPAGLRVVEWEAGQMTSGPLYDKASKAPSTSSSWIGGGGSIEAVTLSITELPNIPSLPDAPKTANELVTEGKRLSASGHMIVILYPSQEWMAVKEQIPFLRYERLRA